MDIILRAAPFVVNRPKIHEDACFEFEGANEIKGFQKRGVAEPHKAFQSLLGHRPIKKQTRHLHGFWVYPQNFSL